MLPVPAIKAQVKARIKDQAKADPNPRRSLPPQRQVLEAKARMVLPVPALVKGAVKAQVKDQVKVDPNQQHLLPPQHQVLEAKARIALPVPVVKAPMVLPIPPIKKTVKAPQAK